MNDYFQLHHPLIVKARQGGNYRILDLDLLKDYAVVYFSSNGIYYPNSADGFCRTVLEKDYYEWSNPLNYIHKAGLNIYVRDLFKQWYVQGISDQVNSIEKLGSLLQQLVQGKKVITVGSSSGGFAAILFGLKLDAEQVFCFSGQVDLYKAVAHHGGKEKNPLISTYWDRPEYNQYYQLDRLIANTSVPILYFYSIRSVQDCEQFAIIERFPNVYQFPINSDSHGVPFYSFDLSNILNKPINELMKLSAKLRYSPMTKINFSLHVSGKKFLILNFLRKFAKKLHLTI